MKTIAISAGHQPGVDSGAVYKDLKEAELDVKIIKYVAPILRQHGLGVLEVPDNLTLVQTIAWINARTDQIDLCLEAHINSGGGTGVEVWHYHDTSPDLIASEELALFVVNALSAETGLKSRGIKDEATNNHGKLGFVHDTKPNAVLAECGFIDGDYEFLKSDQNLERVAKGIARGIVSYLEIPWQPNLPTPPQPQPPVPAPVPSPTLPVDWEAEYRKLKPEYDNALQALKDLQVLFDEAKTHLVNIRDLMWGKGWPWTKVARTKQILPK